MPEYSPANVQFAQRRAILIGILTCVFTSALMCIAMIRSGDGILTFALTGQPFVERAPERNIPVTGGFDGYDGQFAYYIASFGGEATIMLDNPAFRYMRILYPIAARIASFGNPDLTPFTLVGINIIAHSLGAAFVAYLLGLWRAPAILGGLMYATWIGGLYGVRLNLNEPLTFALALGAIVAYVHARYRWAVILLMFAMITKELAIVFAAGLALHAFFSGKRGWSILLFGAPVLLFGTWVMVLRAILNISPTTHEAGRGLNLIPFAGLLSHEQPVFVEIVMLLGWLILPLIILFLLALRYTWRHKTLTLGASLVFMAAGFVSIMPGVTWVDAIAAYRVGMPIVVAGILFVGWHYRRWLIWLAAIWIPSVVFLFITLLFWL